LNRNRIDVEISEDISEAAEEPLYTARASLILANEYSITISNAAENGSCQKSCNLHQYDEVNDSYAKALSRLLTKECRVRFLLSTI
jgi:hypothetical protein